MAFASSSSSLSSLDSTALITGYCRRRGNLRRTPTEADQRAREATDKIVMPDTITRYAESVCCASWSLGYMELDRRRRRAAVQDPDRTEDTNSVAIAIKESFSG